MRLKQGLLARDPAHIQPQHHVFFNGFPGQQQWLLWHVACFASARAIRFAINSNHTGIRRFNTCYNIKKRTLAAAAGADDRNKFTNLDSQVNGCKRFQ